MATTNPPLLPISTPTPATQTASTTDLATSPGLRLFLLRFSDSIQRSLSDRRPWSELIDRTAFSRPESLSDATSRLRKNLSYFRVNYAAIIALCLTASLLSHLISLTARCQSLLPSHTKNRSPCLRRASGSLPSTTKLRLSIPQIRLTLLETVAPSEAWGLSFNPKGSLLAVAGGASSSIKLWETTTWQLVDTVLAPRPSDRSASASAAFVLAVAWSPDSRRLACSSYDGSVAVFDTERGKLLHHCPCHSASSPLTRAGVALPPSPTPLYRLNPTNPLH